MSGERCLSLTLLLTCHLIFYQNSRCRLLLQTFDTRALAEKPICNDSSYRNMKRGSEVQNATVGKKRVKRDVITELSTTKSSLQRSYANRIVNGYVVNVIGHPWMVFIHLETKQGGDVYCGGSILDDRHIVTAKHCIVDTLGYGYIYYGATDRGLNNSKIDFKKSHVIFNKIGYVDVVLIRTPIPIPVGSSPFVQPIALPKNEYQRPKVGEKAFVTGWGSSCFDDGACITGQEKRNPLLQGVEVEIMKPVCFFKWDQMVYGEHQIDTLMCASGTQFSERPQDSCAGDSGGPLTCRDEKNMTYLCGIVSMGPDAGYCGFTPGGYTMTNIPCVFLFLKTRGQKFRGREREPYGIKAERGTCGKTPLRTVPVGSSLQLKLSVIVTLTMLLTHVI